MHPHTSTSHLSRLVLLLLFNAFAPSVLRNRLETATRLNPPLLSVRATDLACPSTIHAVCRSVPAHTILADAPLAQHPGRVSNLSCDTPSHAGLAGVAQHVINLSAELPQQLCAWHSVPDVTPKLPSNPRWRHHHSRL